MLTVESGVRGSCARWAPLGIVEALLRSLIIRCTNMNQHLLHQPAEKVLLSGVGILGHDPLEVLHRQVLEQLSHVRTSRRESRRFCVAG